MVTTYPPNILNLTFDTVIFDLGSVLVDINPLILANILGDRIKQLPLPACRDMMISKPFQRNALGLISFEQALEELYNFFPQQQVEIFKQVDLTPALQALPEGEILFNIARERANRVYILSNITPRSFDHITQTTPFITSADGYMTSFIAKSRKPDPAIYQALINHYTVTRSTTLFLDDLDENCKAAAALGIASMVCNHKNNVVGIFEKLRLIKG